MMGSWWLTCNLLNCSAVYLALPRFRAMFCWISEVQMHVYRTESLWHVPPRHTAPITKWMQTCYLMLASCLPRTPSTHSLPTIPNERLPHSYNILFSSGRLFWPLSLQTPSVGSCKTHARNLWVGCPSILDISLWCTIEFPSYTWKFPLLTRVTVSWCVLILTGTSWTQVMPRGMEWWSMYTTINDYIQYQWCWTHYPQKHRWSSDKYYCTSGGTYTVATALIAISTSYLVCNAYVNFKWWMQTTSSLHNQYG